MTMEPLSSTPEVPARIVEAALRAISRFGLTKLTVDDVAREAGCSRATLYRYFPSRGAVLAAVVQSETDRLRRGLDEALADVTTLSAALAAVAGFGARELAGHQAVQHLLATEPGTLLPHLCFTGGDHLSGIAAEQISPHLCRFMGPLEARRTAEWLGRIVLSYGLTLPPDQAATPEAQEAAVLSVVKEFVAPAAEERSREADRPGG